MPYFINIGRFKGLKGVMGARGWQIWRIGKTVNLRFFGPIELRNRYPKLFTWAAKPTVQRWSKSTIEAAKKEIRKRIQEKESECRANGDKAYQKLPRGQKILGVARGPK
jgi:hypothetical protein